MRAFGFVMIAVGVAYLLYAFNMDVSVSAPSTYLPGYGSVGGGNVANLDLMSRRQNHLIVAALITLIGVILAVFAHQTDTPGDSADSKATVSVSPYAGERDLKSDAYRLWLAKTYAIARNDVFDKFVMADDTFASIDEALAKAHVIELEKIAGLDAQTERKRLAAEQHAAAVTAAMERADEQWARDKPKVIVGSVLATIALGLLIYFQMESPEQRAARAAREKAAKTEIVNSVEQKFSFRLPSDASQIQITEKAGGKDYLCDGNKDGAVLTFSTGLSREQVRDSLLKALGKGSQKYESLPNNFDWVWDKKRHHYELTMFTEHPPTEVNLCMTDAN